MRILHVITSMNFGGAEKLVADLLPRFQTMGAVCELALFDSNHTSILSDVMAAGVPVHLFSKPGTSVYSPRNLRRLRSLIRSGAYDVVHTHNTAPQLFGALSDHSSAKYVTTEHNTTNRRRDISWLKPVDRWMYGRYDRVVCISSQARDNLIEHIGQSFAPKVDVICNGVDISRYHHEPKPVAEHGDVMVTMVAGFRAQKDQDTLIRAMAKLPERFRLQLVGDGVRRRDLEALVKSLGLDSRVDFLGLRSDVPQILGRSDIAVLSSHYEGLSLSSIENMASGCPLVASDVPGIRDIVGGYGALFTEGDADTLSALILNLAQDPDLYMSTAQLCQQRASEFDIVTTADLYMALYRGLLMQN